MLTTGHPTERPDPSRSGGGRRGRATRPARKGDPVARVLFTSARQDGFVLPLLQLVRAMVARGDEVWFLCGEAHRERIEAAGATFVRLPYDEERAAARVEHERPRSGVREVAEILRSLFLETVETDFRTVL